MRMTSKSGLGLIGLTVALAAGGGSPSSAASPAERRAFTIEDFYRVRNPGNLTLSPGGKTLAYDLKSTDLPRGKSNDDLWIVATAGGEPKRYTWTEDASETHPIFSPDGSRIAFVAKRGDQKHEQLWIMPVVGGEAHPLTDVATGVADPVWSPDGRYIAFASEVYPSCGADAKCNETRISRKQDGPLEAHVADHLLYRHWTSWDDGRVSRVLAVEVETGGVRDLTPGDRHAPVFSLSGPRGFDFSPDGKELCFTRNPEPLDALAWTTNSDLWVVEVEPGDDGATRPARNITTGNAAWDGAPRYSPDGRYIAYLAQQQPGYEADRFRLALYDRGAGTTRLLTPDFDNWVGSFAWTPDGETLVFAAPLAGQTPLFEVAASGGRVKRLVEFATIDDFVLADGGKTAYVLRRSVAEPREVWKLDLTGRGEPVRLTHHNRELEDEVDLRPAETLWVEGADGHEVQVFVVKPHGFDASKKYPLILNVHGGPQGNWSDAFRGDWQMYPGAGYVVAFANPHGSTGYGQEYTAQISRDWGGEVFDDLMRVADAMAALPYVDAERMGAMGWSYGGYMMNWFQGHTRRFRCLADMMGLYDLRSFYGGTEELWFPEWDLGGMPWNSPLYETWNPAASAEEFATPMLIISGELDFRVPYTQSLAAFTALRRRDVPARLIILPKAGHWPGWYEMALYYTAHLDWFHRYLGGDPPPWSVEEFADNAVFDPKTGARVDTKSSTGAE